MPDLELAGDDRRAPEHPDEDRHDQNEKRDRDLEGMEGVHDRVVAGRVGPPDALQAATAVS